MKTFLEPLTPDEEKIYIEKMRLGDKKAKDILIERNLRLVAHVVKKYYDENRENQDLISIGIVGLIKAVNTYNPDKGNRLVTYAAKCIENELLMMLRAEKKRSKDVSLNEPIGTDKEGNTISLIDVVENDEMDTLEQIEKAENIAEAVNGYFNKQCVIPMHMDGYKSLTGSGYIVIQTTSVGLYPNVGDTAIEDEEFYKLVGAGVDIIYNPSTTKFMEKCRKAGKPAYNGLKMLLYQGVAAYELWNDTNVSKEEAEIVYNRMKEELGIE